MKYENAKITYISTRGWFITVGSNKYLSKSGEVIDWYDDHCSIEKTDHLIMHETHEQAQATLDKYNKEPTLSEIKEKLSTAKELIGKNIQILKGHMKGRIGGVISVDLALDRTEVKGPLTIKFMEENGYTILLKAQNFTCIYDDGVFEVVPSISVKNHSGQEYFAEQHDKYWQFGCAKISKKLIKDSLELIDTNYADGNRKAIKITIGAADFDFDTLKQLVDADNNKG